MQGSVLKFQELNFFGAIYGSYMSSFLCLPLPFHIHAYHVQCNTHSGTEIQGPMQTQKSMQDPWIKSSVQNLGLT